MGAPRKQDWREARLYGAWEMKQQGWNQQDIVRALAVSESVVSQWLKHGREQGVTSLKSHPGPGPQPKLSKEQREQLCTMLTEGASAHGYHGAVWTSSGGNVVTDPKRVLTQSVW